MVMILLCFFNLSSDMVLDIKHNILLFVFLSLFKTNYFLKYQKFLKLKVKIKFKKILFFLKIFFILHTHNFVRDFCE